MSMQVKLVPERLKSENMCVAEACGAKWRHTCAHKLHEISDQDDGAATSISRLPGVFCARTTQDPVKGLNDFEV